MLQMFLKRHYRLILVAIWIAQVAALLWVSRHVIIQWNMGDPDDQLRLVQVRDWIAGQSWWDLDQYRMNPPDGGSMHWSRIVDVPLAAMILLMTPVVGQPLAEHITVVALPLVTFSIVFYLIASVTRALFGVQAALLAAASLIMMLPITLQIVPMRIDHHGWQLVMFLLGVKYFLNDRMFARSAIIVGLAMAIWIEISIEGLPFAALFMGLFALRWFEAGENRNTQFAWAMASMAATSNVLYFLTEKLWFVNNNCDELSPFHFTSFSISALIIVAGTLALRRQSMKRLLTVKIITSGLAGIAALACVWAIAPQCAGDTFAGLDPLVREHWYDRVLEGLPLWQHRPDQVAQELAGLIFGMFGLIFLFMRGSSLSRGDLIAIVLLFLGCSAIGIQVARASVYALCLSVILLTPAVIAFFVKAEKTTNIWLRNVLRFTACALLLPGVLGANISVLASKMDGRFAAGKHINLIKVQGLARRCESAKYVALLDRLPASQLMAGLDTSPAILQFTRHKVVATGHHRNQVAMRDVILAFTEQPEIVKRIYARRGIEYLVTCNGDLELLMYRSNAQRGLWSRLSNGEKFGWLDRQANIGPYQIWRVRLTNPGLPTNQ